MKLSNFILLAFVLLTIDQTAAVHRRHRKAHQEPAVEDVQAIAPEAEQDELETQQASVENEQAAATPAPAATPIPVQAPEPTAIPAPEPIIE